MAGAGKYFVADFIDDAKEVLRGSSPLEIKKAAIGELMKDLAKDDDLLRVGLNIGHNDATPQNWVLWQEPGASLYVVGLFPGHRSPVHEHGDFWVVSCGYRGNDRWDMYERLDDGTRPGYAEVKLIDQWEVTPGQVVWMPPPPRAIHSHNNVLSNEHTLELLFFGKAGTPPAEDRLIYDVDRNACWLSPFNFQATFPGVYPPQFADRVNLRQQLRTNTLHHIFDTAVSAAKTLSQRRSSFCPICRCPAF